MKDLTISIAIDGPAAAGKSTVAKCIAEKLGIVYVDTGAMYRAFTLKATKLHINVNDEHKLASLLQETEITFQQKDTNADQRVFLDGEDISNEIRHDTISNSVSFVAQHALVRKEMVKRQQEMAKHTSIVMDGRDIGTHVLPEADKKFYLLASVDERANRRYEENKQKGFTTSLDALKKDIEKRDQLDMNRKSSPLRQAKDAIVIDTTSLSIEEVVDRIMEEINLS